MVHTTTKKTADVIYTVEETECGKTKNLEPQTFVKT